jgi:hypothetical protein
MQQVTVARTKCFTSAAVVARLQLTCGSNGPVARLPRHDDRVPDQPLTGRTSIIRLWGASSKHHIVTVQCQASSVRLNTEVDDDRLPVICGPDTVPNSGQPATIPQQGVVPALPESGYFHLP